MGSELVAVPFFRSARGAVLEQYVEHGEQAQRRGGGPTACLDHQLVSEAG